VLSRNQGLGFDGFVFDYWHHSIRREDFATPGGWFTTHPMPAAYPTDQDWFDRAWKPFIEYLTDNLHRAGYRIIGNGAGEYFSPQAKVQWQRTKVDGAVYEQWAVDWPANGAGWLPGSLIEQRINALSNDPLEVWTADYGIWSTDPEYDRKQTVGLAMYYVGIPANQANRSYHHFRNRLIYWEALWNLDIGTPAEPAVKLGGKYFWSRKFTQGLVLLNYESSGSVSYQLDRSYIDVNGKIWSGTVSLRAHSAMILAVPGL
jgi:hypothetical protein